MTPPSRALASIRASLPVAAFPAIAAMPADARALFEGRHGQELFASRPWFDSFLEAGIPSGAEGLFLAISDLAGQTLAVLPCLRSAAGSGVGDAAMASLTSFYSCDYRPLIAPGVDPAGTAFALGRAVARHLAREPVVRFDSLDSTLPTLTHFLAGLARPGRAVLRYAHFGRWWENVEGLSFDTYLGRRNGALRETIRRKTARLARAGALFEIVDQADIERGIAEYEAVYARSWKEPEPFPAFQPTLMRNLARAGWLRLALCRLDGQPIAAQLWAAAGRRATVLKLAHDSTFDALSPGTVLTAFAIRTLMAPAAIDTLDFGRGDDSYKRAWTSNRTPHIGILWASTLRRPLLIARHRLGDLRRRRSGGDQPVP